MPLAIPILLAVSGCCTGEVTDGEASAPDLECLTGVEGGLQIAIWECEDQERIVAWRQASVVGCGETTTERARCGERTSFEEEREGELRRYCDGYEALVDDDDDGA
jgi:hypothetical protein